MEPPTREIPDGTSNKDNFTFETSITVFPHVWILQNESFHHCNSISFHIKQELQNYRTSKWDDPTWNIQYPTLDIEIT